MCARSLGSGEPCVRDPGQELAVGTLVGEYCIEGRLGQGGMGTVYAAVHPVIAKRAAIKVLHPELSVNRGAVERFVQEARAVNQIGHPNIVDIFSFGTLSDGRCYFVMEHLRGQNLREKIDAQPPTLAESLAILDTVTIALEAAHDKAIIHRDLKPDNIFLVEVKGSPPAVKLLDFGIAKLVGYDGRAQITQTGNLLGTPAYISPEQARGQGVDHRTDIYALGGLAYEMFSGQLPYPADSAADMIAKHLYQPPPSVRSVAPHIPGELDQIITRMMAKEAARRPTLAEVRAQLRESALTAMPITTYPPAARPAAGIATTLAPETSLGTTGYRRRTSRGWIYGVLGVVVIAGGVAAAIITFGSRDIAKPDEPAKVEPAKAEPAKAVVEPPKPEPTPEIKAEPEPTPEPPVETVESKPAKPAAKPIKRPFKPTPKKPKPNDDDAPM